MAENRMMEFFKEKKQKAKSADIDWEGRKKAWMKAIEDLYKLIVEKLLAKEQSKGLVKFGYATKTLSEDFIGTYEVRELLLLVGDEKVAFTPKGLLIVGASGRVDMIGEMGTMTLVFQSGNRWGIVASRTPTLKVVPLDEDSLLDALKDVMRQ